MDIMKILDEMEELVDSGSRIPLVGKVLIDAEGLLECMDRIRASLPEEIKQAKFLNMEREKVMSEAQRRADRILEEATNQAKKLISEEQGGGVSIDLIHEWDYLCYLFGNPKKVLNIKGRFSNLEIDNEDLSVYIAEYQNMVAEVHLDYFGRQSIREIQLFMPDDTVVADLIQSEIRFLKSGKIISFNEERNDFQRKEIKHFFEILEGIAVNDNDLLTALNTLRIAKGEL
jgi:predicted dehydrogenase